MNERIRELWTQAGGRYDSGNQHTWPQYTIDDPKKFVELIVQGCAKRSEELGQPELGKGLMKHFGVEE